jgi:hypothetical protein
MGLISIRNPLAVHCDPTVERVDRGSKLSAARAPPNPSLICFLHRPTPSELQSVKGEGDYGGGATREAPHQCVCSPESERSTIERSRGGALR